MTQANHQEEGKAAAEPRPFSRFLIEQEKGSLHTKLSEALHEGTAAAVDYGKTSTVTLTVKIAPDKNGETVQVSTAVKTKFPEPPAGSSTYFIDGEGNLSRSNPEQDELPLRQVGEDGPARVVGGAQ